jgi:hypothetical protein
MAKFYLKVEAAEATKCPQCGVGIKSGDPCFISAQVIGLRALAELTGLYCLTCKTDGKIVGWITPEKLKKVFG